MRCTFAADRSTACVSPLCHVLFSLLRTSICTAEVSTVPLRHGTGGVHLRFGFVCVCVVFLQILCCWLQNRAPAVEHQPYSFFARTNAFAVSR